MILRIFTINRHSTLQNYKKLFYMLLKLSSYMQASNIDFDIPQFKSVMTQDPTKEHGWSLEYEGSVDKEFKGTTYFPSSRYHLFRLHNQSL